MMFKTLTRTIISILILLISNSSHSNIECIDAEISSQQQSIHVNLPTNTKQCISITNDGNHDLAIFSNTLGTQLQILSSNSNIENTSIAADSYHLLGNKNPITINVLAKSTTGDVLKVNIGTEKNTENIVFQNHAINFLLLGLIFSSITVNILYSILKKSKSSLCLGLLTGLTIIYFGFESTLSQLNISDSTAEFIVKALSLASCISGLALLHALTQIQHAIFKSVSCLIVILFSLGLAPLIPLELYRMFFIIVVLHVFISILFASQKQPNLYWYLIGSSIPSVMSLSMILLNELLPTIASYNLVLLAIFLQNLLISKAVFASIAIKEKKLLQQSELITPTHPKTDYLTFSQHILLPQLAGALQLIKHSSPLLPAKKTACSIANLQLIEIYMNLLQEDNPPEGISNLCKQLIDIIYINNKANSSIQKNQQLCLFHTKADPDFIQIVQVIIKEINNKKANSLQYSLIADNSLFISHHHANNINSLTPQPLWLIIDDNESLLSVMTAQCHSLEQNTIATTSPSEAIEAFLSQTLAITHILIDWNLERETAANTINLIYQLIDTHHLMRPKIYIMSAQKIYSANFSDFPLIEVLEKPVTIDKLKKIKMNHQPL